MEYAQRDRRHKKKKKISHFNVPFLAFYLCLLRFLSAIFISSRPIVCIASYVFLLERIMFPQPYQKLALDSKTFPWEPLLKTTPVFRCTLVIFITDYQSCSQHCELLFPINFLFLSTAIFSRARRQVLYDSARIYCEARLRKRKSSLKTRGEKGGGRACWWCRGGACLGAREYGRWLLIWYHDFIRKD